MKAYTDYPFPALGDAPFKKAPIREIEVYSYDYNKDCVIRVEGIIEDIKIGYIYSEHGRCGEVPVIDPSNIHIHIKLNGEINEIIRTIKSS